MKLTRDAKKGDKYIFTNERVFKVRKNGRAILVINPETKNQEIVRVTPQ